MNIEFDLFKDFNRKKITEWLLDLLGFISNPRLFIFKVSLETNEQVFSRYLFYFIIYTFSYFLAYNATDFNQMLAPSILDLFFLLPVWLLLLVSNKLALGHWQSKATFCFVATTYFIYAPISIFLFGLYLSRENQIYLTIKAVWSVVFFIFLIHGYSFLTQKKAFSKIKLWFSLLLTIAIIYCGASFMLSQVNIRSIGFASEDLIYDEYSQLMSGINYDERIPSEIQVKIKEKELKTIHGTLIFDSTFSSYNIHPDTLKIFKRQVQSNIDYLTNNSEKLKFRRNILVAKDLFNYYRKVDTCLSQKFFESTDLILDNYLLTDKNNLDLRYNYIFDTSLIDTQHALKNYNNHIIKLHDKYRNILHLQNISVFISGFILEDLIKKDTVIIPYEKFYKIDDDF